MKRTFFLMWGPTGTLMKEYDRSLWFSTQTEARKWLSEWDKRNVRDGFGRQADLVWVCQLLQALEAKK